MQIDAGKRPKAPLMPGFAKMAMPMELEGATPPPLQLLPHPNDATLDAIWAKQRIARVNDRDLRGAVHRLVEHHKELGFYADRFDGMKHVVGLGPDSRIEAWLAPRRAKPPEASTEKAESCGLCNPADGEKGLRWGDWIIFPNVYPYVPADREHVVLTSSRHQRQVINAAILKDMMRYQQAVGGDVTLHCNGRPSTAQTHLHWHAERLQVPLADMLDDGSIELRTWRRTRFGRVQTLDRGLLSGVVLNGSPRFVARWAERLAHRFESDPRVRGAVDMVLMRPRSGRARLLMVPRNADELEPEVGTFGPMPLRALSFAGMLIMNVPELPEDIGLLAEEAARRSVVHPRELRWLRALLAESAPMIAFRAAN